MQKQQETRLYVAKVNMDDGDAIEGQNNNDNAVANEQQLNIWAARGILLLVAAIWGTNFASVKYLEGLCFNPPCNHPPSEFAFVRFAIAGLVSLPILYNSLKNEKRLDMILSGMECGIWISIGYVTQALALSYI